MNPNHPVQMDLSMFKAGDKTFITIRNQPYDKVDIVAVTAKRQEIAGPIKDNRGNVVLEEGEMLEQADLDQFLKVEEGGNCKTCMKFWVEGITGELPE